MVTAKPYEKKRTRKVSPMIDAGWPSPGMRLETWVMSKIAPRHRPFLTVPRLRSARVARLVVHDGTLKDIAIDS